jgi:hypothetical protein
VNILVEKLKAKRSTSAKIVNFQISSSYNKQATFPITKNIRVMSPTVEYKSVEYTCLMELVREHSYDNPATSPPEVAGKVGHARTA